MGGCDYAGHVGILFEWDPEKALSNARKHAVSFEEAATIFADPLSLTIPDPQHSQPQEERFITIGTSHRLRTLIVVHSDLSDRVRIIGARLATRTERGMYEEET